MSPARGGLALHVAVAVLICLPAATIPIAAQQTTDLPDWMRSAQRDLPASVFRQQPATTPATPDYTNEPFVIERHELRVRFENDGTGRIERIARIRIQDERAVRRWGHLVADYHSANEQLDTVIVVHKADGSTVDVDTASAQDIAPPIETVTPSCTDHRQRHIPIPSLRPGDVLSFQFSRTIRQPLVPNQFRFDHEFLAGSLPGSIVLADLLTLDLPADRAVTITVRPGIEEVTAAQAGVIGASAPGRRVRVWRSSVLTTAAPVLPAAVSPAATPAGPAIKVTSFERSDEVAGCWP
jgi:hypothetical protein